MTAGRQVCWSYWGRCTADHGHADASPVPEPTPAFSGVAPYAAGAAVARSPAACSLCSGDHAIVSSCKRSGLAADFGFKLVNVRMLSPRAAVRVLLAVMTALPAAGAAVLLAHASGTHPRLALQVHSVGPAGSVTQAASATRTASGTRTAAGTRTAPAVVGGPAGIQVTGAAVANAATGRVRCSAARVRSRRSWEHCPGG